MKEFFRVVLYNPLYNLLIFLAWLIPGHSIGWAIIVLTIIIRLILLPSSIKAAKAQAKLQAVQPEINRIRKEIKDQQAQSRALMELYKKEGVSPFGSCLPLLIQMPIIFVLYRVFRAGIDESHFSILYSFTPHPDKINTLFAGMDLSKPNLWVLPILAGVTQFILSYLMTKVRKQPDRASENKGELDPMQMANKQMMYFFPIITVFFARSFPAALALYWIITTIFGIGQQLYVNKMIQEEAKKPVDPEEREEIKEVVDEAISHNKPAAAKKDFLTKMMNNKLDKQEKKTGVEVTIRKKQ